MVRRLVKHKYIRLYRKKPCKRKPCVLSARERFYPLIYNFLGKAKPQKHTARARPVFKTAKRGILGIYRRQSFGKRYRLCVMGEPCRLVKKSLKTYYLTLKFYKPRKRAVHIFKAGKVAGKRRKVRVLLKYSDSVSLLYVYRTRLGRVFSCYNAEKRSLSRTVNTDNSNSVTVVYRKANVLKYNVGAKGYGYI